MNKIELKKKKQEIEDRIVNRILINFGIGSLAYIYLMVLWRRNLSPTMLIVSASVCAAAAVAMFVLTKVKSKKCLSYGIMFTGFSLASCVIMSSRVVSAIVGGEKFEALMQSASVVKLLNAKNDFMFIAVLGGVYLVCMLMVNIYLLVRSKQEKADDE